MRTYRERRKANGGRRLTEPCERAPEPVEPLPPLPMDPAQAVADWAEKRLIVPHGHENADQPMTLPAFAVDFFRDALAPGVREAGLFCARKNSKSAVLAVLILAHLADDGPLRRRGWRCGVASVNRDKAGELWEQCKAIAEAGALRGLTFGKVPRKIDSAWGRAEFLSADRTAGHASGFDLAICDELGLFPVRGGRDLVAGLLSSTSARNGRLIAISVLGDSPLSAEMIERKDDPAVAVHVHAAPANCALDDERAWEAANPALDTVKSRSYMADMARRAAASPNDAADFRVFDLNIVGSPNTEPIVPPEVWIACADKDRPPRAGACFVGIDIGQSASMTCAAGFWPASQRLECYGAFGDVPDLAARGEADGVATLYERMADRGELRTWPGRATPVYEFLEWFSGLLEGESVMSATADTFKEAEVRDAWAKLGLWWPLQWRRRGSGKDGVSDLRSFQRAAYTEALRPGRCLLLESAIKESVVEIEKRNDNPVLEKRRKRGRIDALVASLLAVGAGTRAMGPAATAAPIVTHIPLEELE